MSDFDKFVKLLGQTDGRDKIYKFLGGVFKILAFAQAGQPQVAAYKALGGSIADARSLMRMAKWSGDVPKMQKVLAQYSKDGTIEAKKVIEFFRTLGNFLYIVGDNIAFLAKRKLLPVNSKVIQYQSKVAQFWGFFLAAVLDILALRVALLKRSSDAATSTKEAKAALISFTKDASDVLVCMATVGYLKEFWNPNAATSGALTALSGAVATYLNWKKIK